ncbi:PREDICTED: triggering receptor expressed on myeloid cells 1-like [Odobenus rosmarus divergens]|uniref:Triggering receptor expressed on myeloid cells 1-like n=1 Tax=Odobenus rosmarus divergens TaxID=9708 RepID=A0A9B0HF44_ODORO
MAAAALDLSLKAWQWENSQASPETLVRMNTRSKDLNWAQARRYLLKDCPREVVCKVTGTELRWQDLGLYQCMIDLSPRNPHVLSKEIRLIERKGLLLLVIVLICGFILNKGLVFSVLFISLQKAWAQVVKGRSAECSNFLGSSSHTPEQNGSENCNQP